MHDYSCFLSDVSLRILVVAGEGAYAEGYGTGNATGDGWIAAQDDFGQTYWYNPATGADF